MAMEAGEVAEGGAALPITIKPPKVASPGGIFAVFVVAGLIAGLALIEWGAIPEGTFLALLLFLLLGAIVPPVALTIGVIIVFYLLFTGAGNALANWVKGIVGSKASAPAAGSSPAAGSYTGTYAPLGPSVPGNQPTPANGAFGPLGKSVP